MLSVSNVGNWDSTGIYNTDLRNEWLTWLNGNIMRSELEVDQWERIESVRLKRYSNYSLLLQLIRYLESSWNSSTIISGKPSSRRNRSGISSRHHNNWTDISVRWELFNHRFDDDTKLIPTKQYIESFDMFLNKTLSGIEKTWKAIFQIETERTRWKASRLWSYICYVSNLQFMI